MAYTKRGEVPITYSLLEQKFYIENLIYTFDRPTTPGTSTVRWVVDIATFDCLRKFNINQFKFLRSFLSNGNFAENLPIANLEGIAIPKTPNNLYRDTGFHIIKAWTFIIKQCNSQ